MPFPNFPPRPFTKADVESLKEGQDGCYGLFKDEPAYGGTSRRVWVYIGKGDIRQRLLDHLNGGNSCITRNKPTHWIAVVTPDMDNKEKELIREYDPICNKKIG